MREKISSPLGRAFLLIIGFFMLGLGLLGIVIPLLPTTPFLLLASYCFIRSSDRFHFWLLNNRILGSYIKDYVENRAIKRKMKWITLGILWVTIVISILTIKPVIWVEFLLLIIAVGVTLHILSLKNLN